VFICSAVGADASSGGVLPAVSYGLFVSRSFVSNLNVLTTRELEGSCPVNARGVRGIVV
jgi:hypothetical protein